MTESSGLAHEDRAQRAIRQMLEDWQTFFRYAFIALAFNGISGDYAEFGSHGGTTFWLAYREMCDAGTVRHLWAFDSFEGLPDSAFSIDEHPEWRKGAMGTSLGSFHAVCAERGLSRADYTAVAGFYADTLPDLGAHGEPNDIALAYVDCDLYSSTRSVLDFLEPRLKHGMIVAFDDYYCWTADHVSGERAALREFLDDHRQWHFHRYREIGWAGTSFVVEQVDGESTSRGRVDHG